MKVYKNILGEPFVCRKIKPEISTVVNGFPLVEKEELFYGEILSNGKVNIQKGSVGSYFESFTNNYAISSQKMKKSPTNAVFGPDTPAELIEEKVFTIPTRSPANVMFLVTKFLENPKSVSLNGAHQRTHVNFKREIS